MTPLPELSSSTMECASPISAAPIWQDILAQAMTGRTSSLLGGIVLAGVLTALVWVSSFIPDSEP